MVEELIEISKKMRYPSSLVRSLSRDELTVLEFITTRYMAMSPIVTILDQLHNIDLRVKFEIKEITAKRFSSDRTPDLKGRGSGVYYKSPLNSPLYWKRVVIVGGPFICKIH